MSATCGLSNLFDGYQLPILVLTEDHVCVYANPAADSRAAEHTLIDCASGRTCVKALADGNWQVASRLDVEPGDLFLVSTRGGQEQAARDLHAALVRQAEITLVICEADRLLTRGEPEAAHACLAALCQPD